MARNVVDDAQTGVSGRVGAKVKRRQRRCRQLQDGGGEGLRLATYQREVAAVVGTVDEEVGERCGGRCSGDGRLKAGNDFCVLALADVDVADCMRMERSCEVGFIERVLRLMDLPRRMPGCAVVERCDLPAMVCTRGAMALEIMFCTLSQTSQMRQIRQISNTRVVAVGE